MPSKGEEITSLNIKTKNFYARQKDFLNQIGYFKVYLGGILKHFLVHEFLMFIPKSIPMLSFLLYKHFSPYMIIALQF